MQTLRLNKQCHQSGISAAMVQAMLRKCPVSSDPLLLAYKKYGISEKVKDVRSIYVSAHMP